MSRKITGGPDRFQLFDLVFNYGKVKFIVDGQMKEVVVQGLLREEGSGRSFVLLDGMGKNIGYYHASGYGHLK